MAKGKKAVNNIIIHNDEEKRVKGELKEKEEDLLKSLDKFLDYYIDQIIEEDLRTFRPIKLKKGISSEYRALYKQKYSMLIKVICLVFEREGKVTQYLIRKYAEKYFNYYFVPMKGMIQILRQFLFQNLVIKEGEKYPVFEKDSFLSSYSIAKNEDFEEFIKKYKNSNASLYRIAEALVWMARRYF